MFKNLVGKGHAEFATGRQQDAREYLDHLMEVMSRAERAAAGSGGGASAAASVPALFKFQMEERIQCGESNMVRHALHLALAAAMQHVVLRSLSTMDGTSAPQHEKRDEQVSGNGLCGIEKRARQPFFRVHLLSNKARGFHF